MPCELYSQDLALQVRVIRVYRIYSRVYKGKKVFEYRVNILGLNSPIWITGDQLRILLDPILIGN
jgi:hypothetical protein